jgi:hypothetical protein
MSIFDIFNLTAAAPSLAVEIYQWAESFRLTAVLEEGEIVKQSQSSDGWSVLKEDWMSRNW